MLAAAVRTVADRTQPVQHRPAQGCGDVASLAPPTAVSSSRRPSPAATSAACANNRPIPALRVITGRGQPPSTRTWTRGSDGRHAANASSIRAASAAVATRTSIPA